MTTPANTVSFDAGPLVEPVDRAAARAFARELRASGRVPGLFGGNVLGIVLFAVFGVFFLFMFATVGTAILGAFLSYAADSGNGLFAIFPVVFLLVAAGVIVAIVIGFVKNAGGASVRWYRLDRFARANGMSYVPVLENPPLPGMIFSLGGCRAATDLLRGEQPRFVEFANYRYETGSGKERTTHRWGYVAVKLDVPLPNIVLDAKSNNALFGSNLPATFDKSQRLSLEGDFDQHFALYCPAGYERDALYLFTPDIMARFIDHAAALDVEIVDDWLFLYGKRDFSTLDPATWAWLFSVVHALLDKFAQWGRWRDERLAAETAAAATPAASNPAASPDSAGASAGSALPFAAPRASLTPPPGVAPPGRRLQRSVPWVGIFVVALFMLVWFAMQSGMLGAFLNR